MSDLQRQIDELEEQTELFQLVVDLQKKQLNDVNYKNVLLEANLQMSLKREKGLEETINTPPSIMRYFYQNGTSLSLCIIQQKSSLVLFLCLISYIDYSLIHQVLLVVVK